MRPITSSMITMVSSTQSGPCGLVRPVGAALTTRLP